MRQVTCTGRGKRRGEEEEVEMGKKIRLEELEEVEVEHLEGGIVTISLNRPATRNALSRGLVARLRGVVEELREEEGLRVVILRSKVRGVFSSGADLKERSTMAEEEVVAFLGELRALVAAVEELPVAVVAALDGSALGGGLELVLGCDLRVAARGALLGLPEVRRGVVPGAGGTQRLARLVGGGRASQLVLTGAPVPAEEAERWGLVNYCVEQEQGGAAAYTRALALARDMAGAAPLAVAVAKVALREGPEAGGLEEGLAVELACYSSLLHTRDRREGVQAFLQKRQPVFLGK